eukprot:3565363-Lingulodinium_polyedra.AAC.1
MGARGGEGHGRVPVVFPAPHAGNGPMGVRGGRTAPHDCQPGAAGHLAQHDGVLPISRCGVHGCRRDRQQGGRISGEPHAHYEVPAGCHPHGAGGPVRDQEDFSSTGMDPEGAKPRGG